MYAMAFLRCVKFLRGGNIRSGRVTFFPRNHSVRRTPETMNSGFKECTAEGPKRSVFHPISNISIAQLVTVHAIVPSAPDFCWTFLVVSCSSRHIHHSNTSEVEGAIPAVGALAWRPQLCLMGIFTTFWWTCCGRVANQLGLKCASSSYQLECQWHSCRSKVQNFLAGPYAMICPGFMLIFVWYLASSAFILFSSEVRASATTEPTNQPPKPNDPKDRLHMATSQGIPVLMHLDLERLIPWLLAHSRTIDHKSI